MLNTHQTFDFITDIAISNENDYLTDLFLRAGETMTREQEIQDNVFKQVYIPRTLQELSLEEIEKLKKQGNGELYGKLTGLAEQEPAKEEEPTAPESPEG